LSDLNKETTYLLTFLRRGFLVERQAWYWPSETTVNLAVWLWYRKSATEQQC